MKGFRFFTIASLLVFAGCGAAVIDGAGAGSGLSGAAAPSGKSAEGAGASEESERPTEVSAETEGEQGGTGTGTAVANGQAEGGEAARPATDKSGTDGEKRGDSELLVIEAGTLPRDEVVAVLDQGIARFLQKLEVRPVMAQNRFLGWRLVALLPADRPAAAGGIAVGDTLLRVNGRSVERPEGLKTTWDSLYTARELVFLVLRGGKVYQVRYEITHPIAVGKAEPAGAAEQPGARKKTEQPRAAKPVRSSVKPRR